MIDERLQHAVNERSKCFDRDHQYWFMKLMEELGELAQAKLKGYSQTQLEEEWSDCLICLEFLRQSLGIENPYEIVRNKFNAKSDKLGVNIHIE